MASRFLGIEILVGLIYFGQSLRDGALVLSRGGAAREILPTHPVAVIIIILVFLVLELTLNKSDQGGGYAE